MSHSSLSNKCSLVPYRHSVRIRFKASGGVTLHSVSSPTRNSSRRKFFTCSVSLLNFLALRAQPRGTLLELLAVEVLEVLWVSGIFVFREEHFAAHCRLMWVEMADKVVVRAVDFSTPFLRTWKQGACSFCAVTFPYIFRWWWISPPRSWPFQRAFCSVWYIKGFKTFIPVTCYVYTTRRNAVPVATVALLSIFRLHCSFIDNCNHGQTIYNLFAWHINVAILPSLTYLSTCALSGAIFRSHTSLPLFASLKLWSFNTSPWRVIITAALKRRAALW